VAAVFKLGVVDNSLLMVNHCYWHVMCFRFTSLGPCSLHPRIRFILIIEVSVELLFEFAQ